MNNKFKRMVSLILSVAMVFTSMTVMYTQPAMAKSPTIYVVGDSTGCHYSETADATYYYKRVGFGDKIADYLNGGATVENLALSGRSSLSFTKEANYQTLLNNISAGDILLIAFGHNDEKVETEGLGTEPLGNKETPGSFKYSLYTNYIKIAQDAGATPVLCSPIVRLPKGTTWTDSELHKVNGGDYAACARDLASELGIDFIDLTELTKAKYLEVGFAEAANFHAHPNESSVDNTHLNNYGAKMVAYLIATAATGVLKSYMVSSPAVPYKATELVVNPEYAAPPEGDLTGDDLISSLWTTTSPWHGSAFGVIGGNPSTTNFDISENGNTVHIKAANDKGKISSTADGLAMYYQPVSANENFQISATAHINSIDSTNDQVGFGAIMADSIKVDTRDDTFNIKNYVAASPLYMAKGAVGGFAKIDSTISKGPSLATLPQAGDDVNLSIVKNGTKYTVTYGNCVSEYQLTDTQMQGIMYVGLFAARNADITFSNIIYNNEVVEGEIPSVETSTEVTTEAITEETTVDTLAGESFIWWADDNVNASGKLDVKSYVSNGATIKVNNVNANIGVKGSVTDAEGIVHNSYQIKKNDAASNGYLQFTSASDGWATFYMYVPSGKNYTLTNLSDNSASTVTDMIYTVPVTAGVTYQLATTGTNDFGVAGVEFKKKEPVKVSGTITVNSADGNTILEGSTLTFTNNSTGETAVVTLSAGAASYEVELYKDFDYTVTFNGTDTLLINSDDATATVSATEVENTLDITLVDALPQAVTGTVYGPAGAATTITFGDNEPINVTIGADGTATYNTELKPGRYSVAVGTIDGYTASSLSTAEFVVKANSTENYKNILYTKPVAATTACDVYVDQAGTYYADKANVYTNLTDAMAAIDASALKGSSGQRFTVHVAPGLYEEQFFVNSDYVSIIADSDGDSVVDGDVKISWYYGIDYMYYSIDPATGFYSKEYAIDKHTKTTCIQKWGATMIVKGSNFYSEGIVYQNTFNLELRDAELADGVENDMSAGSASNTTYDRTQADADVRLTTATERAAALVIDGQQAEFYNCQFLGSQDTVYTGSYSHYFKNCLLAGETDYIFGNGGTTIFDNCELQWIDYHYAAATDAAVKQKAGYIAVPRGSYIFRDCDITSSGLGLNVTTGNPVVTKGYYGRPWGDTASAIFMNCNTNDLILADGWAAMSGVAPEQVAFKEYNNLAADGTTVFYSTLTETSPTVPDGTTRILTDDEATELVAEKDWNFFGTWLPINHIPYAGNPNIYKFDFTTGNVTSPVSDGTGTAQLTHSGIKFHGTTYGGTLGNGGTMTIYAGSDAASMDIAVNSSYNGNVGTLELYKNDETAVSDSITFDNANDNEIKTFTVTDVKAGDTFTVKYVGTATFYCGNVTVTSDDGTLTTAPVTNTYEFDFAAAATGHAQGEVAAGDILDKNGVAAVTLGNNVKYHGTQYGFMLSNGAEISFDVTTAGKATITVPSSYSSNIGTVVLVKDGAEVASTGDLAGIVDGTITADLEAGTYTLRYDVTGTFYTAGLTIVTEGELGQITPVPTNTYKYDFAAAATGHTQGEVATGELYDVENKAPVTLGNNVKYHSTQYGFMLSNGAEISFDVTTAGKTTITVPSSYSSNIGTAVLVKDGAEVASTGDLAGIADGTITADLEAGTYTLRYDVTGTFYTAGLTIVTEGELGQIIPVPTNTYKYDFAAAATGHTQGEVATGELYDAENKAPVTLGNNVKYHGAQYGFMLSNGAEISFDVTTAGKTTITVPSSYSSNIGTVVLVKDGAEVASTGDLAGIVDGTITADLEAGTYTLRYDVTGTFYTAGLTIVTEGELGQIIPVPTNTYKYDFAAAATGHTQGEVATGELYDAENKAPVTLGNNVKYHGAQYGFMLSNGAEISFDVTTAGKTTITVPSSYSSNIGTVVLVKDSTEVASTGDLTGIADGTITADLEAGTYTLRYDVTGTFYTAGLTIVTEGELGIPEPPIVYNDYMYNFVDASTVEGTSAKMGATDNELAKITLDANTGKFGGTIGTTNGYQINNGSKIGFTLAGSGDINATITVVPTYSVADNTIEIYKADTDTLVETITISAGSKDAVSVSFTAAAGDYEMKFNVSSGSQYLSGLTISIPETAAIGARPDVRGNANVDDIVDILDAIDILKNVDVEINSEATLNSDVDLDGKITKADAATVLKIAYVA